MDAVKLISKAITAVKDFLHDCHHSAESRKQKTAALLSYWLCDYIRMLRKESGTFPYRRFKRGEIVKVHLGYRIGNEEGGLHYAIVLTPNDSPKSSTLIIIPLTSLKSPEQRSQLHFSSVFLGTELFQKLSAKAQKNSSAALQKELAR